MAKKPAAPRKPRAPAPEGIEALQRNLSLIKGSLVIKQSGSKEFDFPEFGFFRKTKKTPCAWGKVKGKEKPVPPGRVELDIVTGRDAERLGVKSGPALRLCLDKNTVAPIVSVASPEEAREIGAAFRDCVIKNGTGASEKKTCALDTLRKMRGISEESVRFAGVRKTARRRRRG